MKRAIRNRPFARWFTPFALAAATMSGCAPGDSNESESSPSSLDSELTASNAPVADSFVHSGYPSTNFGTKTSLYADNAGTTHKHAFLKFKVPSGTITSARLRLYLEDGSGSGFDVYAASNSWSETSLTWNDMPSLGAHIASVGAVSTGTWVGVDVAGHLTPGTNATFVLVPKTDDGVVIASREASTNHPRLVVDFADSPARPLAAGLSQWPEDKWASGPFTGVIKAVEPGSVLAYLEEAAANQITVFIVYPRRLYTTNGETVGPYSASRHRALTDAYAKALPPDTIKKYVASGTLGGFNTGDDYGCAACWGGTKITPAEARDGANYAKQKLPDAPVGVRVHPEWMLQVSGWKIDYGWAQYQTNDGDPKTWYDHQALAAPKIPVNVVYGVNVHDCDGPNHPQQACTASQLKQFGTLAVNYPHNCAFVNWRYDDGDWSQSDLRAVWYELMDIANTKPFVSCKRF